MKMLKNRYEEFQTTIKKTLYRKHTYYDEKDSTELSFSDIMDECFEKELDFINEQIDHGADLNEVWNAFDSFNSMTLLPDTDKVSWLKEQYAYKKQIAKKLNERRMSHILTKENIKDIYYSRHKFTKEEQQNETSEKSEAEMERALIRDNASFVNIILEKKLSPEAIDSLIASSSAFKDNSRYVNKLRESCMEIKAKYDAIAQAPSKENVRTVYDAYCYNANRYMRENKIHMLYSMDEEYIVALTSSQGFGKEAISSAMQKCSPIAIEPLRDKQAYINMLLDNTLGEKKNFEKSIIDTKSEFAARYKEKNTHFDVEANAALAKGMKFFTVGVISKEMLREKYNPEYLCNTIKEFEVKLSETEPFELIDDAVKSVKAEQDILSSLLLDRQILEESEDLFNLYTIEIGNRIKLNESIKWRLDEPHLDRDICEKMLTDYPNISEKALSDMIKEKSPRALLPGIDAEKYANNVIASAKKMIEKNKAYNKSISDLENEYNLQCGLSPMKDQAYKINSLNMYTDGTAAIKMLSKGISELDVRNIIMKDNQGKTAVSDSVKDYADTIISSATNYIKRVKDIKLFTTDKKDKELSHEEYYVKEVGNRIKNTDFVHSSMDIAVVKNMLYNNASITTIKKILNEKSPVICEPGRDTNYVEYIMTNAEKSLNFEKEKLEKGIVFVQSPSKDAEMAYTNYKKQTEYSIDLPWKAAMDILVVEAMLIDGIAGTDISNVLRKLSPMGRDLDEMRQNAYIDTVLDRAEQKVDARQQVLVTTETIEQEVGKNTGMVRELSRTIETHIEDA